MFCYPTLPIGEYETPFYFICSNFKLVQTSGNPSLFFLTSKISNNISTFS